MPRPAIHQVASPRSWAVLVAPVRLEIVETMRMIAPCSIAEIAGALDRPADALYRHIEKLRRAGFVTAAGARRAGRRTEQVFDLVADDFRIGFKGVSERAANKAYDDTLQSLLKIAARTARDSARACQLVGMGVHRNVIGKIEHAWLTPAEFNDLRDILMRAKEFMDARKRRREDVPEERLYLGAFVALPVTRKRGARRRKPGVVSQAASRTASAGTKRVRGAARTKP
ncbi:MAG: helix-turn-helix domain-containing protein [Planctomycetaceae bacterium]|nr:helix-turn-helix domain-containing protein [Planctomycetaceae bacterium]